ncbi:MAG TPA: hypothetical protein VFR19_25365 [Hyphomicrobiaceae bacterium]|jgi:hypothetical protein|nr:hypothetical protein [Hyphomicrobiaceae bacterium]
MTGKIKHFLVSVPVGGGYMHGYVMTNDERVLSRVGEHLIEEAEKRGGRCWPPIILSTRLDDGWKIVREIINKHCGAGPRKHWKKVRDFHLTGWAMRDSEADNDRLMELH